MCATCGMVPNHVFVLGTCRSASNTKTHPNWVHFRAWRPLHMPNMKTHPYWVCFPVPGPSACAEHENAPSSGAFSCLAPFFHIFRMCRAPKRTQFGCIFVPGAILLFNALLRVPSMRIHSSMSVFSCSTLLHMPNMKIHQMWVCFHVQWPSVHAEHRNAPVLGAFLCSTHFCMCRAQKRGCIFIFGTIPHVAHKSLPCWVLFLLLLSLNIIFLP